MLVRHSMSLQEVWSSAFLKVESGALRSWMEVPAMHTCSKMLLTTALLMVAASISVAQEQYHSPDPDVMARLSYDNLGVAQQFKVHHVCIAVSRDGEYRIVRSTDEGQTERLHGKMPKDEFNQLSKLLEATDFRSLSGYHGGLVRQEAETFVAEIPVRNPADLNTARQGPEPAWRLQWLNGDGGNSFPASVSSLVDWIKRFQPKDGKTFEYTEYPDVCPTGGLRFLQPSVAGNSHP
jgi:hypothetical protein